MKKIYVLLILSVSAVALNAAEMPVQMTEQQPQGWYDWSKQKLQTAGSYVPSLKYWPGITAGLSGASLLGLKYASPYMDADLNETLTLLSGLPAFAYTLGRGYIHAFLNNRDLASEARAKGFRMLYHPDYMQSYAPQLLGTSAALLFLAARYEADTTAANNANKRFQIMMAMEHQKELEELERQQKMRQNK